MNCIKTNKGIQKPQNGNDKNVHVLSTRKMVCTITAFGGIKVSFNHPWIFRCWKVSIHKNNCQLKGIETLWSFRTNINKPYPTEKRTNSSTHTCVHAFGTSLPEPFLGSSKLHKHLKSWYCLELWSSLYIITIVWLYVCRYMLWCWITMIFLCMLFMFIFYIWSIWNDDKCIFLVFKE